jgi:spore maturation protein CgeB
VRFVIFCHSLVSDWNHGNAHFLRGVVGELLVRGHAVDVYEPADGWSAANLRHEHGEAPFADFAAAFPGLRSTPYRPADLDLDAVLAGADVVVVHEWNDDELVGHIGEHRRATGSYLLFFHDTHHRAATAPAEMAAYDLSAYDAVLAFGQVVRDHYLEQGWARRAFTWHEAADTRVFHPRPAAPIGDLVWIGNWGDEERSVELEEFLVRPARQLGLRARVYGVRYPEDARRALSSARIEYGGWLANHRVPEAFARFRCTVHVPRRPYVEALPGIPTIRPFEALACGIPLVSAPWDDTEGLFAPGEDFLVARDGYEMRHLLEAVLRDAPLAARLRERGLRTIRARHTCAHRVDELLEICRATRPEEITA